ncbi:MAG: protein O-mannosyl-transferase, partial [Verrucomicrobiota bacterium]
MATIKHHIGDDAVRYQRLIVVYLCLATVTWIVFGQTINHQFVHYDDQNYVYENPEIAAGITLHGISAAFTHAHARNWHPLTTISHMLDCQLFGLNPAGHHFTNILLHLVAVLLLFSAFQAMTGKLWHSAFVAAVFAIHPLRAESVAWVAERKDVLSAVFFMLTLGAYFRYTLQPSRMRYFWIALCFALGLMAKPMLVTLPLLLLLLDYWPLARFRERSSTRPNEAIESAPKLFFIPRQLIWEKLPLLALSLVAGIATLAAQQQTIGYGEQLPLTWRIGNAFVSCLAYIGQLIWPAKLAVFYPHSADHLPGWQAILAFLVVAGITCMAFLQRKTRPYLIVGWCWYLICLLPVIGLIQVGLQGRADRYTYLPQIGLCFGLTWAVGDFALPFKNGRRILACTAVIIVVSLAWRGWIQTSYWCDTESLWKHAAAVTSGNDVAHYNIAAILLERGDWDGAISHYEKALEIQPNDPASHYHVSVALVHNCLGNALARKGRPEAAIFHYRKAVELRADYADAHSNLAELLARQGQAEQAIEHYQKALAVPPEDAASHLRLAAALVQAGRDPEATVH